MAMMIIVILAHSLYNNHEASLTSFGGPKRKTLSAYSFIFKIN